MAARKRSRDGDLLAGAPPAAACSDAAPLAARLAALLERDARTLALARAARPLNARKGLERATELLEGALCSPADLDAWLDLAGEPLHRLLGVATKELWKASMRLVARIRRGCPLAAALAERRCGCFESGEQREDQERIHAFVRDLGPWARRDLEAALGRPPAEALPADFAGDAGPMDAAAFEGYRADLARWLARLAELLDALWARGAAFATRLAGPGGRVLRACAPADLAAADDAAVPWAFPGVTARTELNVAACAPEVFQTYRHLSALHLWAPDARLEAHCRSMRTKVKNQRSAPGRETPYGVRLRRLVASLAGPLADEPYFRCIAFFAQHAATGRIGRALAAGMDEARAARAAALQGRFAWEPYPAGAAFSGPLPDMAPPGVASVDGRAAPALRDASFRGAAPRAFDRPAAPEADAWPDYRLARRAVFSRVEGWRYQPGDGRPCALPHPARLPAPADLAAAARAHLLAAPDAHPRTLLGAATLWAACGGRPADEASAALRFDLVAALVGFARAEGWVRMGAGHPLYVPGSDAGAPAAFCLLGADLDARAARRPLSDVDGTAPCVIFEGDVRRAGDAQRPRVAWLGELRCQLAGPTPEWDGWSAARVADGPALRALEALCGVAGARSARLVPPFTADARVALVTEAPVGTLPRYLFDAVWARAACEGHVPPMDALREADGRLRVAGAAGTAAATQVATQVLRLLEQLAAWRAESAASERVLAGPWDAPCGPVADAVVVHAFHLYPDAAAVDPAALARPDDVDPNAPLLRYVDRLLPAKAVRGPDRPYELGSLERAALVRHTRVADPRTPPRAALNRLPTAPAYGGLGPARRYPAAAARVAGADQLACSAAVRAAVLLRSPDLRAGFYGVAEDDVAPHAGLAVFLRGEAAPPADGLRLALRDGLFEPHPSATTLPLARMTVVHPGGAPPDLHLAQLDRALAEHVGRADWPARLPDAVRLGYLAMALAPSLAALWGTAAAVPTLAALGPHPVDAYSAACVNWAFDEAARRAASVAEDVAALVAKARAARAPDPLGEAPLGPAFEAARAAAAAGLLRVARADPHDPARATKAGWALHGELARPFARALFDPRDEALDDVASVLNALACATRASPPVELVDPALRPALADVYAARRATKGTTERFAKSLRASAPRFAPAEVWAFDAKPAAEVFAPAAAPPGGRAAAAAPTSPADARRLDLPVFATAELNNTLTKLMSPAMMALGVRVEDDARTKRAVMGAGARPPGAPWVHGTNILQYRFVTDNDMFIYTYVKLKTPVPVADGLDLHFHVAQSRPLTFTLPPEAVPAPITGTVLTRWLERPTPRRRGRCWAYARVELRGGRPCVVSFVTALPHAVYKHKLIDGCAPWLCEACGCAAV